MWQSIREWWQGTPGMPVQNWANFQQYRDYRLASKGEYRKRYLTEVALIAGESFCLEGYCFVCRAQRQFAVTLDFADGSEHEGKRIPNWREQLKCTRCGNFNRIRAMLQFVADTLKVPPQASLYLAEQLSPLYPLMKSFYPNLVGSEHLGDKVPRGTVDPLTGLRNEDLLQLSFADNSLDAIVTCDVFEHIPDIKGALAECCRCLKPGAVLAFSIPFNLAGETSELRARLLPDGQIEHLKEPQYHGDPLSDAGCLCFHDFGWDLLDHLREAGFSSAHMHTYWSRPLCYLGGEGLFFSARK